MKLAKKHFRIAEILAMSFIGGCTEKETEEYVAWKQEREENEELAGLILNRDNYRNFERVSERFDCEAGWKEFAAKYPLVTGQGTNRHKGKFGRRIVRLGWVAAVVVMLGGILFWLRDARLAESRLDSGVAYRLKAGTTGAQLILADGEVRKVTGNQTFLYRETDSTIVLTDSAGIDYAVCPAGDENKLMNTVRTLTGMEYALTLADGTKVYLNAESEIRFPMVFNSKQRVVEVTGEVYFEVAKNAACPFVVKTRDLSVKVLGTSFNVRAYDEDHTVFVTLTEGKVQVFDGCQFADIVPGEQAVYGKATKKLEVNCVEVSRCMAWRNGMFIFRNERLEDIIICLARWYDIKYRFMDERIKDVRIGAKLDRYADMNPSVEMLTVNPAISVELVDGVYCIASK